MSARILVVDDASFIRDMVKKNLRTLLPGVTLFDAPDGHRAVSILKKQSVDIILSDWEMPGMSGEELLQWVRATEAHAKTPFVMVTSRGDREFVVKAVQAGVSDYLVKPFTPDELMTKVSKQLKRLGIDATSRPAAGAQGVAFGSIEALTGKPAAVSVPAAEALAPKAKPKAAAKAPAKSKKGMAQLRLAGQQLDCLIRELSLQALNGIIQRTDQLPQLFESAVLDITDLDGNAVARVNGYISSLQAAEARMDTRLIKITIRFVDDDPAKFESLSKYIAKL
ncbi:response regulator [Simiduia curdlanivorans]|uniref:Response regulator n=1 Tax=Simiduia curdlanivorans TaxID=1492769 RepID=A0ABV8V0W3_9GAMM|nr:response regulator [Simiduia curdlanivorans]MDN3637952.1 response regulator [Simiduia curdlanivorans]